MNIYIYLLFLVPYILNSPYHIPGFYNSYRYINSLLLVANAQSLTYLSEVADEEGGGGVMARIIHHHGTNPKEGGGVKVFLNI